MNHVNVLNVIRVTLLKYNDEIISINKNIYIYSMDDIQINILGLILLIVYLYGWSKLFLFVI